jgi:hypothetical protein
VPELDLSLSLSLSLSLARQRAFLSLLSAAMQQRAKEVGALLQQKKKEADKTIRYGQL